MNICLEPEAAAIYCKTVPSYVSSEGESVAKVESFKEGDSYLLLDAGGMIELCLTALQLIYLYLVFSVNVIVI